MKLPVFFLVLMTCGVAVQAQDVRWRLAAESRTVKIYYDKSSLVKLPNGTVRAWTKLVDLPLSKNTNMVVLSEFQCETKEKRDIQYVEYKNDKPVGSDTRSDAQWAYVIPETVGESVLKVTRGGEDLQSGSERIARTYVKLGEIAEKNGDMLVALDFYRLAIENNPDSQEARTAHKRLLNQELDRLIAEVPNAPRQKARPRRVSPTKKRRPQ